MSNPFRGADPSNGHNYNLSGDYYGFPQYNHLITTKDVWAGPSAERAFTEDIPWAFKRQAQVKYFDLLEQNRRALVKQTRCERGRDGKWRTQPQISAFYTSFPWPARASVGHTLFMDAERLKGPIVESVHTHLREMALCRQFHLAPPAYQAASLMIAHALGNRALFDMMGETPALATVEFYRLFQAAQTDLLFRQLNDIVTAVVLLGDLLPNQQFLKLHPMTAQIMETLLRSSWRFFHRQAGGMNDAGLEIYLGWSEALMRGLARFLPREKEETPQATEAGEKPSPPRTKGADKDDKNYRFPPLEKEEQGKPSYINPLADPPPPQLDFGENNSAKQFKRMLERLQHGQEPPKDAPASDSQNGQTAESAATDKILNELGQAIDSATRQNNEFDDMREDLVEQMLGQRPFEGGPITGQDTEGKEVKTHLGDEEVGGELFDRNVALCEDILKTEALRHQAAPVAQMLRRNLYPSLIEDITVEYPRASGQLDARRLPLAQVSDAVYRRSRSRKVLDPGGRVVMLIAADASASLTNEQMQMCKCLLSAWLESVPSNRMQVLAAFYHSGGIRARVSGPLVQWVYHPRKTPVYTPREAVRAVASLPDQGSGAQSDALSLTYLLDEAQALSCGARVYVTLISDCAFNKSFRGSEASPEEEVTETINNAREQMGDKLHVTLVALEGEIVGSVRKAVDAVIPVDNAEIKNPAKVAETVGAYVAACIRERRKETATN